MAKFSIKNLFQEPPKVRRSRRRHLNVPTSMTESPTSSSSESLLCAPLTVGSMSQFDKIYSQIPDQCVWSLYKHMGLVFQRMH